LLTEGLPAAPTRNVSVDLATSKAITESDLGNPSSAASAAENTAPVTAQEAGSASNAPGAEDGAAGRDPPADAAPESAPTVTTLRAQKPWGPLESPPSAPISSPGAGSSRPMAPIASAGVRPSHRGWSVQLGSFASKANAEKLVHQLAARVGPTSYVSASGGGSTLRYRVRVGPFTDRGAAERAAGKLRASGHAAAIVAPVS
jgi:cell division septation protein DedD